ncbi:hypothetical protein SIM91_43685 [Rhodococcus opacus]|uniref:hypothetical protein n=1 Tax=Rhodococcus opacus TaxID=37919 RepID=UPI0002F21313|nr:hypothetical protein [Rhodococcus opacus]MDX5970062.1 hypothetical protein [Rhodococcus opacus]CAG7634270.1 hypothetical protein E143388_07586 [Rhodococcus opacus]
MGEWILWGLNVVAGVALITAAVQILWWRPRIRRKQFEHGLDHLADGGPYVTFGWDEGPLQVHTQDGVILASWSLARGEGRTTLAAEVLDDHGWQNVGQLMMLDADTLFAPVAHRPVQARDAEKEG